MHPTRILIVEDDAVAARALLTQLKELGYEPPTQAANGEAALILAEQMRPELVLMDILLAGTPEGAATVQAMRERFAIPVVFVNARLNEASLQSAKTIQTHSFLTLPFQSHELRIAIDLALIRHHTEIQLRQTHEQIAVILRTVMDGFWMVDLRGRFMEVNDACCRMHGYTREEMLRLSVADLEVDEAPQEVAATIERIKKSGCERFERRHRCRDASIVQVEVSINYLPISGGRFFCFLRDITERKRAAEALRESEHQYRQLVEMSPDAIFVQCAGKIAFINPAGTKMLGATDPAQIVGKALLEFVHPDCRAIIAERIKQIQAGKPAPLIETRYVLPDGRVLEVEVAGMPFPYRGQPAGQVIAHDITERKREAAAKAELEAQNRQLQKAESLGRMAGAIAHHFNNQLHAVMGNLELAMSMLPHNEDVLTLLAEAMQAARKATEVSGWMQTYLGQTRGQHEPLDLAETCRRSLPVLRAAMPPGMVLETDLPSPGPTISAITHGIQLVLTNLVTNAWEASKDRRGAIRLTVNTVAQEELAAAHRFPFGWQPQDHAYACLAVTDSGCGIADQDFEKLFDPFFSHKSTGRGIGLSVVLGIAGAHDGAVTVTSEPGQGSTFRVFFPMPV